jgi:hypothetical protein
LRVVHGVFSVLQPAANVGQQEYSTEAVIKLNDGPGEDKMESARTGKAN